MYRRRLDSLLSAHRLHAGEPGQEDLPELRPGRGQEGVAAGAQEHGAGGGGNNKDGHRGGGKYQIESGFVNEKQDDFIDITPRYTIQTTDLLNYVL